MYQAFLLAFCQVVVGCVFAVSSFAKIKDFSPYLTAVAAFRLVPTPFVRVSALFFLVCEILVVILLFIWPIIAFSLAVILLLLFSVALTTVLVQAHILFPTPILFGISGYCFVPVEARISRFLPIPAPRLRFLNGASQPCLPAHLPSSGPKLAKLFACST